MLERDIFCVVSTMTFKLVNVCNSS